MQVTEGGLQQLCKLGIRSGWCLLLDVWALLRLQLQIRNLQTKDLFSHCLLRNWSSLV